MSWNWDRVRAYDERMKADAEAEEARRRRIISSGSESMQSGDELVIRGRATEEKARHALREDMEQQKFTTKYALLELGIKDALREDPRKESLTRKALDLFNADQSGRETLLGMVGKEGPQRITELARSLVESAKADEARAREDLRRALDTAMLNMSLSRKGKGAGGEQEEGRKAA